MKTASTASTICKILLLSEGVDFCGMDKVFLYDAFIGSSVVFSAKTIKGFCNGHGGKIVLWQADAY